MVREVHEASCRSILVAVLAAAVAGGIPGTAFAAPWVGETERVSVGVQQANAECRRPALSSKGRHVAFSALASNLVPDDGDPNHDIFVRDVRAGSSTRVSVDSSGTPANESSAFPSITPNGRYVAFESTATNLVPGDTNSSTDVFVHDRKTGVTTRVSVDSSGTQGNGASFGAAISPDGRFVAFASYASNLAPSDTNGAADVFVHDRKTGTTTRASIDSTGIEGDGASVYPAISRKGRYVAFSSSSTNLVAADTNGVPDVFVHDLKQGVTTRVSVDSGGGEGDDPSTAAAISSNGRYVSFESEAENLVGDDGNVVPDVFVHDRKTGQTTRVSVDSTGGEGNAPSAEPAISSSGRYVAFRSVASNLVAGDGNAAYDVFVHDRKTGQTMRASVDSSGSEGNGASLAPEISPDGWFTAFESFASNLVDGDGNGALDVFVHEMKTGKTMRESVSTPGLEAGNHSVLPEISANGRYVAFASDAVDLVPDDENLARDVFLHDLRSGRTMRMSVDSAGQEADSLSSAPSISANGRYVAFVSTATNLVAGDGNAAADVFVHDRKTGQTTRVSVDSAGSQGNSDSFAPAISPDGRYVAFESLASNLVVGDVNGANDVFVHDRKTGQTIRASVDSAGAEGNGPSHVPAISTRGRHVAFQSLASNLVAGDGNGKADVFVRDLKSGVTTRVSIDSAGVEGNDESQFPAISKSGRHVAFESAASNLVAGDGNGRIDIFVHDLKTGATVRVSIDSAGAEGNGHSHFPAISNSGRHVAFESAASNLVVGDANGALDVFVHEMKTGETARVSVDSAAGEGNAHSYSGAVSSNGRLVSFTSEASDLVASDTNGFADIFVRDRK